METIYWIFGGCAALAIALVILNGRFPGNPYVKSIREWQTLIGAFVGFAAVSMAILLQGKIMEERETARNFDNEVAILQSAIVDAQRISGTIMAWNQNFEEKRDEYGTTAECTKSLERLRMQSFGPIAIEKRMDSISGEVSVLTYVALSRTIETVNLYIASSRFPTLQHCVENGRGVMNFLVGLGENTLTDLRAATTQMQRRLLMMRVME